VSVCFIVIKEKPHLLGGTDNHAVKTSIYRSVLKILFKSIKQC